MASISVDGGASWDFISLRGTIAAQGEQVEEITRPNVDGHAYAKRGKRGLVMRMRSAADGDDAAGLQTTLVGYKALEGSLVTVIDDFENEWENVLVLEVTPVRQMRLAAAAGGLTAGLYLIECDWTLQHTEIPT